MCKSLIQQLNVHIDVDFVGFPKQTANIFTHIPSLSREGINILPFTIVLARSSRPKFSQMNAILFIRIVIT